MAYERRCYLGLNISTSPFDSQTYRGILVKTCTLWFSFFFPIESEFQKNETY